MLGFTGTYRGHEVSVMGGGMGIPSTCIYAHELIHFFGATRIIRVGSCGGLQPELDPYEIIVAQGACTDSRFLEQYRLPGTYAPLASWRLLSEVTRQAEKQGVQVHVGNILSSDYFYGDDDTASQRWARMGVLGVEMESAGLYAVAAHAGVEALGLFTVSDNLVTGSSLSSQQRETSLTQMMELALPLAALAEHHPTEETGA